MTRALDRAFLAVVPPRDVLDALDARVTAVRQLDSASSGLRWSRREQWHITLRFLGRVPDVDRLLTSVRDSVAREAGFHAQSMGGGAFSKPARASVLWVGLGAGADELTGLAASVEVGAVMAGFEPEARPFTPHVTIARGARPCDLRRFVGAIGDDPIGPRWPVDGVVLMSSDTRPDGAVYAEVGRVGIRAPE